MKLGYSTWGMPTVPIDVIIPHLAKLGYDGVELTIIPGYSIELSSLTADERKRIRQMLLDYNLELPAIAAHTSLIERDPDLHANNWRRLTGAVDLALDWALNGNPPAIDTTPGGKPEEWEMLKPHLVERTAELVEYAAARGVVIAMEPHVGSSINSPARVLELLDLVQSPYLKVNFDISHFNIQNMPIEETVAALAPVSAHTHVKDERGTVPDFEFLIPGEGIFDYVRYLKTMAEYGYTGTISAEISLMVQRRPGYDPLAAAEQTYAVLSKAFAAAGIDRH
jgi:sugar phosphate isomerase/epimerase